MAREHCLVEHRRGLVIRDAGKSQIGRRNACLAEKIGEGGSNLWVVTVATFIEGRDAILYQRLGRYQGRLRSSRLCVQRIL
jgi:hypothetical protein